jgi:hypothetical protein
VEVFQLQTAEYIREITRQLADMARRARLLDSQYILEMAHLDATEAVERMMGRPKRES